MMLALDVSQSMRASDVAPSRIEAAKAAAVEFADLLAATINLGMSTSLGPRRRGHPHHPLR